MVLGGHSGTHIDALCHVSHRGKLYDGHDADKAQKGGRFAVHGAETIPLTLCRGVMLDIPGLLGVEVLAAGTPIKREHLASAAEKQKVEIRKGDAVLIRSGWPKYWADPAKFIGLTEGVPGPDEDAAHWLVERQIRITGAETIAYEHIPPGKGHALLPVHRVLLVQNGIFIVESLNLAELAQAKVFEFLLILTPIKVVGATGVPVRPVAVTV
ncbi:MAG: cyclase family protein, partial [Methanomicrobiales archaeon]|nr:cyclase family protein [Methanomicrobiales archaeon]